MGGGWTGGLGVLVFGLCRIKACGGGEIGGVALLGLAGRRPTVWATSEEPAAASPSASALTSSLTSAGEGGGKLGSASAGGLGGKLGSASAGGLGGKLGSASTAEGGG
jgi:hypothetical protein